MQTRVAIIIFFSILFSSCRKEIIVIKEVPRTHSWLLDSSLTGHMKFLLTSAPLNDSILAVANHSSIWYINSNKLNKGVSGAYLHPNPTFGHLTPPSISKTISVSVIDSNQLRIFVTGSPGFDQGSYIFVPAYTNATYSLKGFASQFLTTKGYPIINSRYILAPTEIDFLDQKTYCSLIEVKYTVHPGSYDKLSFVKSKTITLTPAPSSTGFHAGGGYFSASYYDKFFLSYFNQFYRIDTVGNIKAFGDSPVPQEKNGTVFQMFRLNTYLFAVGSQKFYVSQDEGENWTVFLDTKGTLHTSLSYFNVGDELYATFQSQLWRVTLTGSSLNFQELDNDGLQTNEITSVNKSGKYAFVTTLAGLYYRDLSGFNTPKR